MSAPRFWKMSGAGNDFVVVDEGTVAVGDEVRWARAVCRRRHGVGADGVLFVGPAGPDRVTVRFRNPDGSEAFCGNGSRCAALYAWRRGFAGRRMTLQAVVGPVPAVVEDDRVRLELPAPRDLGPRTLDAGDGPLTGRVIDAGCPHYVVTVDDPAGAPLERWGPAFRRHPSFGPAGTNFDLVGAAPGPRALRTWERGVEGETLACGSGAVAAALAVFHEGGERRVTFRPAGGIPLEVELTGDGDRIDGAVLAGDAVVVFEGRLHG